MSWFFHVKKEGLSIMYTNDTVISAAIAEDYIQHIRMAKDQLKKGNEEVCLLLLRSAEQLISHYLCEMSDIDLPLDNTVFH